MPQSRRADPGRLQVRGALSRDHSRAARLPVLRTLRVRMHVSVITWRYRQVASACA
jgi:hypothetical protein